MAIIRKEKDNYVGLAKEILMNGGLVAFPTETVYGLGANALNGDACRKIYLAKGRPSDNPLIIHIGKIEQLYKLVKSVSDRDQLIIDAFWPGPLTLIFKKSDIVPDIVSGGLDTVAIRMPSNDVALKLLRETLIPMAAPSANLSGKPSPTSAKHVIDDLNDKIDMIIDGGEVEIGIESTILDLTEDIPKILRPGYITKFMLEEVLLSEVIYDEEINGTPKAPGMKYKHYAPNSELILLDGNDENLKEFLVSENPKDKALILTNEQKNILSDVIKEYKVYTYGDGSFDACKSLYAILRDIDTDSSINKIYSVIFEKEELGYSLMNRLEKAAGLKILKLD